MHTKDTLTVYCVSLQPVVIMLSGLQLVLTQFLPPGCSPTEFNFYYSQFGVGDMALIFFTISQNTKKKYFWFTIAFDHSLFGIFGSPVHNQVLLL